MTKRTSLTAQIEDFTCNVRDLGSIPGLGRGPGEGNGNPLQYSCLENHMERGAWRVTVHGVAESNTNEKLSTETKKAIFSSPDPQIVYI